MGKRFLTLIAITLSIFLYSCGGGGGQQDDTFSLPSYPEGTLTVSTNFVTGGQTYTVSWTTKNADTVTLEVRNLDALTLMEPTSSPSAPLPSPVTIGSGPSGSITETAVTGKTRMYELKACNSLGCDKKLAFVWEKQSILDAYAVKNSVVNPPVYVKWPQGVAITVCTQSTKQYMQNAVQTVITATNNLLNTVLTLTFSSDPAVCGSTITSNYVIIKEGSLSGNTAGYTTFTYDSSTVYFTTATIVIDTSKVSDYNSASAIMFHEFSHMLGFWSHVNPNIAHYTGPNVFLMTSLENFNTYTYDELTPLFLESLYGLR